MESIENMMRDDGVFVIEAHYLLDFTSNNLPLIQFIMSMYHIGL